MELKIHKFNSGDAPALRVMWRFTRAGKLDFLAIRATL